MSRQSPLVVSDGSASFAEAAPAGIGPNERAAKRQKGGRTWTCGVCTLINESAADSCDVCEARRAPLIDLCESDSNAATPPPREAAPAAGERRASSVSVLSFNVWFHHPETFATRMAEVGRLADVGCTGARSLRSATTPPALLALQELTPSLLAQLQPHLARAGYRPPFVQPWREGGFNGMEHYCVALATRPPLGPLEQPRYCPFSESIMGRGLVMARVQWPGVGHLLVGTAHLESWVGNEPRVNAAVIRARQKGLKQACSLLEAEVAATGCIGALLVGDMNWQEKDNGDARALLSPQWKDAWEAMGAPKEFSATCGFSWRLDRCFYYASPQAQGMASLQPTDMALIGRPGEGLLKGCTFIKGSNAQAKPKPLPPSDHKGLLVSFTC
ncbi:hypothetical protein AB1Y20_000879 [Prymnesium parvum]|uniref:RanBP2-type domain-containing protein n=1 Tax=Prymnesium parvum TaxID=97485 RepID=A0AB34KB06_PRYPA